MDTLSWKIAFISHALTAMYPKTLKGKKKIFAMKLGLNMPLNQNPHPMTENALAIKACGKLIAALQSVAQLYCNLKTEIFNFKK